MKSTTRIWKWKVHDLQAFVWQLVPVSNQGLDWEQEPTNPQNSHAIKIFGVLEQMFTTKQEVLGYVPHGCGQADRRQRLMAIHATLVG